MIHVFAARGLLLSEVLFWYQPKKTGGTRLKSWHDGDYWMPGSEVDACSVQHLGHYGRRAILVEKYE